MARTLLVMISVAVMTPALASAADQVRVKAASAAVRQRPEPGAAVVADIPKGTLVDVIRREGDWFWVLLPADEFGTRRAGYIRSADVEDVKAVIPPAATAAPEHRPPRPTGAEPPPPVVPAGGGRVQPRRAPASWRIIVGLGAGYSARSSTFDDRVTFTLNREQGYRETTYSVDSGAMADGGIAVRLWRGLAAGLDVTALTRDGSAEVTASVPHPFFFERPRGAMSTTAPRGREIGVHPNARWVLSFARNRASLSIVAGPSFFQVDQDIVTDLKYREEYPYDTISISASEVQRQSASGLGYHVGADLTYMFTRTVGAGAAIRYSHASVELTGGGSQPIVVDAGGPQAAAGIRLRF